MMKLHLKLPEHKDGVFKCYIFINKQTKIQKKFKFSVVWNKGKQEKINIRETERYNNNNNNNNVCHFY